MDSDRTRIPTRRRILKYAGVGLATSLAGCSDGVDRNPNRGEGGEGGEATPPNNTDDPDGEEHEMPEDPPAQFKGNNGSFPFYRLPEALEVSDPTDLSEFGNIRGTHPDNSVFDIEVTDENTAELTISKAIIDRPIDLTLYVRDADDSFREVTTTLSPTGDEFTTVTHTFDLSNITLSRIKGGFIELVIDDSDPGNPYTRLAKRHQYVGIPHSNGVEWINSPAFNFSRTDDKITKRETFPRGVTVNGEWKTRREEPAGAIRTIDGDNQRTVMMAVRTPVNGEVYGVSCHIDHDAYNDYKNGSNRYRYRYGPVYECTFAKEISHYNELGTKTSEAMDKMGLTAPHKRINALGDLVQMLPYTLHGEDPPGTVCLYEGVGDCSSKSMLLSCIMQNDPWNLMPGFIDCDIDGINHWTVGIDVRDLGGGFNRDNAFTVEPTTRQKAGGFPDTEYAFWDMTYDAYIGQRTDGVEGPITIYDEGDFSNNTNRAADDPPNY